MLGGAESLAHLCHVALDGLVTGRTILGGIGIGQSWPRGVVSCFDGCKPGGLDWESCCRVEVLDKGSNAGEIVGIEGCRDVGGPGWGGFV